jgi:nitrite reductase (NAD(P)H)
MAPPGLVDNESKEKRKKVVVVGLGMVVVAFVEKLIAKEQKRQESEIVVLGEEKHVAYNRVGLTSFFSIRPLRCSNFSAPINPELVP